LYFVCSWGIYFPNKKGGPAENAGRREGCGMVVSPLKFQA
jgi:hypothetical protein